MRLGAVQPAANPDIFISYSRRDRRRIARLAGFLNALGLVVWFDADLPAGRRFPEELFGQVARARLVLVCWSRSACRSEWVADEARMAMNLGKLVSCRIKTCRPAGPFADIHHLDLRGWSGVSHAKDWHQLLRQLGDRLDRPDIVAPESRDSRLISRLRSAFIAPR